MNAVPGSGLLTPARSDPGAEVLILSSSWPTAERPSYGVFVQRQVDTLIRAGLRADVLVINGRSSALAYPTAAALMARRGRRRGRYRLVHAHSGEAGLAAVAFRGAPVLVSFSGSDVLGPPGASGTVPWRRQVQAWLCRASSRLIAVPIVKSSAMREVLPRRVRPRTRVIPNGVDPAVFHPQPREAARAALGWAGEDRVVLFAADPSLPYKRFPLAERACALAADALAGVRLVVASDVAPERMPVYMNGADCLLHTSASEGSPNVIKEALACDLPIVATPAGDIEERLAGLTLCHVCPPQPAELARALVACLESPRRSPTSAGIAELHSDRIAARLLALYREVGGADVATP